MPHSKHRRRSRSVPRRIVPGVAPGTVTVDPDSPLTKINLICYGPDSLQEQRLSKVEDVAKAVGKHPVTWVDVDGLGSADVVRQLGQLFQLHPLALEDTVNTHQRAKVDDYGDILYVVLRMISGPPLESEQISCFVGSNFLLTFQEGKEGDSLGPVRERIRQKRGRIRDAGVDYLLYEILDAVIDGYFPVLETLGTRLDELDESSEAKNIGQTLAYLHELRRDLLFLRRIAWPLRDAALSLMRNSHTKVAAETQIYLRDCYDHATHLIDILEIYRETCADLRDFYYSKLNNRTNEIMRTLTVIATLFMPLSFIAGLYGMNFENMPELKYPNGYFAVLSVMASVASGFCLFFWHKGWLRSSEPRMPISNRNEEE